MECAPGAVRSSLDRGADTDDPRINRVDFVERFVRREEGGGRSEAGGRRKGGGRREENCCVLWFECARYVSGIRDDHFTPPKTT